MTRRKFNADVASAANIPLVHVSGIKKGDDDGQVDFVYTHDSLPAPVAVRLLVLDVDGYPEHPGFLAFTSNERVPAAVTKVLEECPEFSENKKIVDICRIMSRKLTASIESAVADTTMTDADTDTDCEATLESDDNDDEYLGVADEDVDIEYDLEDFDFNLRKTGDYREPRLGASLTDRLVEDLRMAQKAGFRVGIFSDPYCVYSLSIPAQSLGLQEDSLAAWGVEPKDFLVFLFMTGGSYAPADEFIDLNARAASSTAFRFGKCAKEKPAAASVARAFDEKYKPQKPAVPDDSDEASDSDAGLPFQKLLISNSMDWWMNKDFASLLKLRIRYRLSWDESIAQLIELSVQTNEENRLGIIAAGSDGNDTSPIVAKTAFEPLNLDFVHQYPPGSLAAGLSTRSLPLIAAQFALRYFAQGPRYCMVCHCRSKDDFEAMKPYVCSKELCLFQYMSLGFGQSIEQEIITQPLVVDLLVSFCYIALVDNKLRHYPKGLGINVPVMPHDSIVQTARRYGQATPATPSPPPSYQAVKVLVNLFTTTVSVDAGKSQLFKAGGLFAIRVRPKVPSKENYLEGITLHCKVLSTTTAGDRAHVTYDALSTFDGEKSTQDDSKAPGGQNDTSEAVPVWPCIEVPADLYPYDRNIDILQPEEARRALLTLLDTLPSIMDMHNELENTGIGYLADCRGISAPALAILRWIVCSNRSMIMQVDCPYSVMRSQTINFLNKAKDKLHGIGKNCVQFKLAQGSPDKEQRFFNAVETNARKLSTVPTIFAWHGSASGNWHSIIRQGLDYTTTVNGRAYGHGVYFSNDYTTSAGYSTARDTRPQWPRSALKISSSISLCEIVNRPDKFVSRTPHYVVADVDWIQCRYLLVTPVQSTVDTSGTRSSSRPGGGPFLKQDPMSRPVGPGRQPVEIPSAALPNSRPTQERGMSMASGTEPHARLRHSFEDDLDRLMESKPGAHQSTDEVNGGDKAVGADFLLDQTKTDFRPGTLDIAALPKLPAPTWADDNGRKVLGRELMKLQKVQSSTPLHEMGWYMDFDQTENLFHWIVELHSFDPSLPFTQDMKRRQIPSIVLEFRFGRQFPMSPPFVRVIRPRFLPFAAGGGGHVTAGGAMCMELLTNSGWSPANSMESVILQVRMAICNVEPRPARLERTAHDYGISEAIEAYKRVALRHGWQIPPDLDQTARGL